MSRQPGTDDNIEAAIFDLDGTVVENSYDWPRIKQTLGSGNQPILSFIEALAEPERSEKMAILEEYEAEQTAMATIREGMAGLVSWLRRRGVKTALVTNNSRGNTAFLLKKFGLEFDLVITREGRLWKPSGAPFREVMRIFGIDSRRCCVVGDTRYDLEAAGDAGIRSVFMLSDEPGKFAGMSVEVFSTVEDLKNRLAAILA